MPPDHACKMESRIKELEKETEKHREDHRRFYERFNDLEKQAAITVERYSQIKEDTTEIKASLKKNTDAIQELKDRPVKRWDGLVDKAIWAVCAAVIAFLLAKVGL